MREVALTSIGVPPALSVSAGTPGYEQARYCQEMSKILYDLATQGFVLRQAEQSDYETLSTSTEGLATYLSTWIPGAINASAAGTAITPFDPSYIPALVSFVGLALTGQWGGVFLLFVKVGIEVLAKKLQKDLDPDTATGDMVELLTDMFAAKDESGNIVGSKLEGLADLQIIINNLLQGEASELYSVSAMQD